MIPEMMTEIERFRALAERQCLECDTITPVRIHNLQAQIATLHDLLRQADSLIETFPRHYASANETDAIAYMIQRDCWQAFQERCWTVRAGIRSCLAGEQKGGF
jgi:hypothetical protein